MEDSTVIGNTKTLGRVILDFIERSPWRDSYAERIKVLMERVDYPCELAIVGQVKAGKSSFLNAFLGDDWAMVGTTETTATINFFKYGVPDDPNRPIKVVWDDGREDWQTRGFLDSLQGNSPEVLEKAKGIDHLEYYLQNPILQRITLVDTPGTNALVDAHNARANEYITGNDPLREKHNAQSVNLKNRADAVIVITGRVPNMTTSELVASFSHGTSAFNSIGVMTKIDLEPSVSGEDWQRRCAEYSEKLHQQLSSIVPLSANIYHTVEKLRRENRLGYMQQQIRKIPEDQFERLFNGDSKSFLGDPSDPKNGCQARDKRLAQYGLTFNVRKQLAAGIDWMVFCRIMKSLYFNSLEDSVKEMIEYSGMEKMKTILEQQFFKRSRMIRCSKIVQELHSVLDEILQRRIYYLRRDARNRQKYLEIISNAYADEGIKSAFSDFVKENIYTKEQYDEYEGKLQKLVKQVESLQLSFGGADKVTEGLMLLEKKQDFFSPEALLELEVLFGKYPDKPLPADRRYVAQRQLFWRGRKASAPDSDVRRIIELAVIAYGTINTHYE